MCLHCKWLLVSATDVVPPVDEVRHKQNDSVQRKQFSQYSSNKSPNKTLSSSERITSQSNGAAKPNGDISGREFPHVSSQNGKQSQSSQSSMLTSNQPSSNSLSPAHHQRNASNASTVALASELTQLPSGFVVAFHRKMVFNNLPISLFKYQRAV